NNERLEGLSRAFDDRFFAFYQVQYMHCATRVVGNCPGEPMASSLNELELMQACALFSPAVAGSYRNELIDQVCFHPIGSAIPLDVALPMLQVNRSRVTIQSHPTPVPQ